MSSGVRRFPFVAVVAATIAMNAIFFLVVLAAAHAPSRPVVSNVEESFATGSLVEKDYLVDDWVRGLNQYNDCMVIQLAVNPRPSAVEKALAPVAYVTDDSYSDVCSTLRRVLDPSADKSRLFADRYARYWHGYIPIASTLLRLGDMSFVRIALRSFVFAALLALSVAALGARGPVRLFGLSVTISGALFWGLEYYGQGLSYAPGDSIVMLGLAGLIFGRRFLEGARLPVCAAAFGSLVAFFEMLTGQLATASCLLFVAAYLLPETRDAAARIRDNWSRAAVALSAFAIGAILTVAIKQALAALLVGPDVVQVFFSNLQHYSGIAPGAELQDYVTPFTRLLFATHILTYRSIVGGVALLATTASAWLAAAYLALRSGDPRQLSHFLVHLVGASGIIAWVLLLPTHTAEHAAFMVRILIVPISLGWSALTGILHYRRRGEPSVHRPSPAS